MYFIALHLLQKVVSVTEYIEIRREYHKTAQPKDRVLCSAFNEVNIQIIQTADMTREREKMKKDSKIGPDRNSPTVVDKKTGGDGSPSRSLC